MSSQQTASTTARPSPALPPAAVAGAAALVGIYIWVFWDFLRTQVRWAIEHQADWGHTLVIPFIAGYFAWLHRDRLLARPFRTAWWGLLPVVLGLAWYTVCLVLPAGRNHNLQALGVWLTLSGLVLLFFGFRAMRFLWFPLVYLLVFGQSISNRAMNLLTFRLQDVAARGSFEALRLLGLDVELTGNSLFVYDGGVVHPLNIAEACSGMRMLMAFLALGVAMAYTGLRRPWQQVLLVLLVIPTALLVNVLRIVTLAMLSLLDVGLAAGDFHTFVGLVWLVPAFLVFLGLMWVIQNIVEEAPAGTAPTPT
jgi:exosortase